uniref:Uncharacterized protein n=1 Tax=Picea glauca TaxID=3330 RepID=A0A101M3L4_PICGL|nr:hypothetical protein ABT39_MTgene223 [Picea glauca]
MTLLNALYMREKQEIEELLYRSLTLPHTGTYSLRNINGVPQLTFRP